jgi:GDP-mannose transporter
MMASMTMNVVNKEVAVKFSATTLPVMLQMVFAMVMFTVMEWRNLKCAKLVDLAKWSVVPFFFTGMLYTSIHSLKELPLSAVLILRNVLPIFTLCGEKILYGKPTEITSTMVLSMLLALLGTTMYGSWNLTVTRSGVLLVIGNCVMTVFDRILQRHFLHDPDFSLSLPLCMVWNNFLGMIIICGLAYANGEMLLWRTMAQQASTTAWSLMLFSCICGCSLGYLGLKCQRLVSATTFLMLQNFTKVFLILIGMGYFGDSVWGISALGCTLSMCGTMWYSYDRLPVETAENSKSASTETDKLQSLSKARAGVP